MANSKSSKKKSEKGQGNDRLPFEPKSKKSKKSPAIPPSQKAKKKPRASREGGIPEVVSKRMAKRMAFFCGVPTLIGLATLPTSYFLTSQEIVALPNTAVLLFSLLCLGISVVGLTYGVLSASWDEADLGSLLGISEFQLNLKRLLDSWKEQS